jgi:UDP-GlcNAc:undecaprenyl-phosphate GlcNAc-1-phosphate transferase
VPFLIALAVGLVLTPGAIRAGRAAGLLDRPGDPLKIHSQPVPVLGGLSVVGSTFAALAVGPGAVSAAVVAGVCVALVVGLLDDVKPLGTRVHLLLQLAAGAVLAIGGLELAPLGPLGAAGAVVLTLVCMNAVNLIDGQDGLAGGLATIAALSLAAVIAIAGGDPAALGIGLALAGSCAAFLVWNRPPARIFLGNGGAYAVGVLLAVLAATAAAQAGWRGLLAGLVCLGIFLFELAFTVARRLRGGGLAAGDREHSYDLLSRELGSRGRGTAAFLALGALAGLLGLAIASASLLWGAIAAACGCAAAAVWGRRLWARRAPLTTLAAALALLPGCAGDAASAPNPAAGTFVGQVGGSDALVAVIATVPERNARERVVQVFVCDGERLSHWLPGRVPAQANRLVVSSPAGAQADVQVTRAAAQGTITLPTGRRLVFRAARATGIGGLYLVTTLPDGAVRGQSDRGAQLEGRVTQILVGQAGGRSLHRATVRIAPPGGVPRTLRVSWPALPPGSPGTIRRVVVLPSGEMKGAFKHALRTRPPGPPS